MNILKTRNSTFRNNVFGFKTSRININNIFFQPKLTINQPNDIYEHETDAMADKSI